MAKNTHPVLIGSSPLCLFVWIVPFSTAKSCIRESFAPVAGPANWQTTGHTHEHEYTISIEKMKQTKITIGMAGCLSHARQSIKWWRFGSLNQTVQRFNCLQFSHEFVKQSIRTSTCQIQCYTLRIQKRAAFKFRFPQNQIEYRKKKRTTKRLQMEEVHLVPFQK